MTNVNIKSSAYFYAHSIVFITEFIRSILLKDTEITLEGKRAVHQYCFHFNLTT